MAYKKKRLLRKITSWAGLLFFILAAYMLFMQLSKYSLYDIKIALLSIPQYNLVMAFIASMVGYVALSSYDYLALKYIKRKVAAWKWIFAGFVGFSVSNNAGHAIVSGGTIRYRLYGRWRFSGSEIVKMVTFSGFTYLIACFFLINVGYWLTPEHAFGGGNISKVTAQIITIISFAGLVGYFAICKFHKAPVIIKGISFKIPKVNMAFTQMFLGAVDILMAASVLYFVLQAFVDIPFLTFMGVFIIAQVLGVFSQVPGGLGVFEGLFMYIIPKDGSEVYLFGALVAYRIIYYLVPLILSAIMLVSYEVYLRYVKKQKLEKIRVLNIEKIRKG